MYQDFSGCNHETYPGEFARMLQRASENGRQMQDAQQQNAQPQQQEEKTPRATVEIIFVDDMSVVEAANVKSGTSQTFAAKDNSFFAVKSMNGNSYNIDYYPRSRQAQARYATMDEVQAAIAAAIAQKDQAKAEANNGTV
jgi:hypothetical protein